jgi:uncharacterized protein (TIGR00251 family)
MTALLRLKVTPNAPANAVLGESDGVIRLKLQAPAVEGKANAALVAFLAETLQVRKAAVSLKGGRRSRLKQVEVQGLDGAVQPRPPSLESGVRVANGRKTAVKPGRRSHFFLPYRIFPPSITFSPSLRNVPSGATCW